MASCAVYFDFIVPRPPHAPRALNANQTVILPWRWTDCTEEVQYSRYGDTMDLQCHLCVTLTPP